MRERRPACFASRAIDRQVRPARPAQHLCLACLPPGVDPEGPNWWLADVGFGGGGPAAPLPLLAGGGARSAGGAGAAGEEGPEEEEHAVLSERYRLQLGDPALGEADWSLFAVYNGVWCAPAAGLPVAAKAACDLEPAA